MTLRRLVMFDSLRDLRDWKGRPAMQMHVVCLANRSYRRASAPRDIRKRRRPLVQLLLVAACALLVAGVVAVATAAACSGGYDSPEPYPTGGGTSSNPSGGGSTGGGTTGSWCGKTVDCARGDEAKGQTDRVSGGRGLGLSIVRSYASQASAAAQAAGKGVGLWGWGWTGPYGTHLVIETTEFGQEIVTVVQQNGSTAKFYKNEAGEYEEGGWVQAR